MMKNTLLSSLLFTFSLPMLSCAASFDCNLAKQDAEKLVCSNIELSKLDDELSKLYSGVKVKAQDKNQLMSSQLDWLKYDRNNCNNLACVFDAYESRMDILNAWILNQGVPNSSGMYWGYVYDEQLKRLDSKLQKINSEITELVVLLDTKGEERPLIAALKPQLSSWQSMRNSDCETYTNLSGGGGSWVTTNGFKCEVTLTKNRIVVYNSVKDCLVKSQESKSKDGIYKCLPILYALNLGVLDT